MRRFFNKVSCPANADTSSTGFVCVVCCGFWHVSSRKSFSPGTVRQFTFLSRFSYHPFQPLLPPACAGNFNSQCLGDFVCLYFLCVRMLMYPCVLFYAICKRIVFLIDQDSLCQRSR